MSETIVIRGGTVVDGTGAPGRQADVSIDNGYISWIGPSLRGDRELDATGQIVAPGFIDVHTHYDAQVFWDPQLTPSAFHGVTTVIAGNCGFTIAPGGREHADLLGRTLETVEDMSYDTLVSGVPWDEFTTFPEYLDAIERRGVGLNFASYVGHTALRIAAMGAEAYERAATPTELDTMVAGVRDALAAGAVGFATTASSAHNGAGGRPVPSRLADHDEFRALLAPLRDAGRGVAAMVLGDRVSARDIATLQREVGQPFTWTALLAWPDSSRHVDQVSDNLDACAAGADVWPQISCRPLVFNITMNNPFPFNFFSSFQPLLGGTTDNRAATYRDAAWRDRAAAELDAAAFDWSLLSITESPGRPDTEGLTIADLARPGERPLDVVLDLALADGLATRLRSVRANSDPDAVGWLLGQEHLLLGVADSGAHVTQLCDACFATDLLGRWVRDLGALSMERAVHKLTGEPARVFGLRGRGRVAVGAPADLCVFDPATVGPGPTRRVRDFPAGGERLTADAPTGVTHVLVNGVPIRVDGVQRTDLDLLPGTVLRG